MESDSSNEVAAKTGNRQMGPVAENADGSTTTPPTKPVNSDGTEATPPEINCDSSEENCEMPEPPEGFDGEMPTEMQGGFAGRGEMMQQASSTSDLHPAAYLAIGGGSVILGILVSYVCFSKFFHLKPGQAFSSLGRFIGFIAVALVLAIGICVLGYFIPVWVKG